MLIGAGLLLLAGLVAGLLSWNARFRTRAVTRFAASVSDVVPPEHRDVLEDRVARRTRAVAVGIIAAGVVLLVLSVGPLAGALGGGVWVPLALVVTLIAVALAAAEIWWPVVLEDSTTRTARVSVPVLSDYLPRYVVILTWSLAILGMMILVGMLALGHTRWFDAAVMRGAPAPLLGMAVLLLAILTAIAVRRILHTPQPSRNETELYWQDAVRASTLAWLHGALGLVAVLVFGGAAERLDAAASAVASATGEVGPEWTGMILVGAYVLAPVPLVMVMVFLLTRRGRRDNDHFRRQLWARENECSHGRAGA